MTAKVFLTEPIHSEAEALLSQHVELEVGHFNMSTEDICRRVTDIDVLFSKTDPILIDRTLIDAAPKLQLIARHGSGFSNVSLDYASKKGIRVTNTPGVNAVTMAEYTIGLMFAAARRIVPAAKACHDGSPDRLSFLGIELHRKTFGVVGVGQIGRQVVVRANALGMKVLAHHPRSSARNLTDLPLELVDLDRLLHECDVVSLHVPLTEQTRNLIGEREFGLMKKNSILLNLSRGGVVNESALYRVLESNSIFAAATDVLANEPVQANEPLLQLMNCLVLPHIASVTGEAQKAVAMAAVHEILRFSRGEPLYNVVNLDALNKGKNV